MPDPNKYSKVNVNGRRDNVIRAADLIANSDQRAGHVVLVAADLAIGGPDTGGGKRKPGRRRPSLAKELRDAKKAGMSVKGAIVEPGRITLTFGDPAEVGDVNEWDRVLP
jgi:hypothetical protein